MRTSPTANSKLRPELNLNRAEVTEWNRKLKGGFAHSGKEKEDVRRNQKAHVLHKKALVLGEHTSLFLSSSTCSGEQLNNSTQLVRDTVLYFCLIQKFYCWMFSTEPCRERPTAEKPWPAHVSRPDLPLNFLLYSSYLLLAVSLPSLPPNQHFRQGQRRSGVRGKC